MKKYLLGIIGGLALLFGGIAIAQVTIPAPSSMGITDRIQVIPQGQPTTGNVYATLTQMRAWILGGASGHSGTPAISSCGGGTPTIVGTDNAFHVTQGSTATGCVLTFAQAFTVAPTCVAVNQTAPGTSTPAYTISTTAITLVTASTSGEIWNVVCIGS